MSPKHKVKYITIYANSEECKSNFKNDIASKNIFDRFFLRRRFILYKETNLQKKLHTYFTKSIYTYNGDAIHNIHAGSLRTTSYRSL